jgi:hypothetical protein
LEMWIVENLLKMQTEIFRVYITTLLLLICNDYKPMSESQLDLDKVQLANCRDDDEISNSSSVYFRYIKTR